jgi:hypothetical protein
LPSAALDPSKCNRFGGKDHALFLWLGARSDAKPDPAFADRALRTLCHRAGATTSRGAS